MFRFTDLIVWRLTRDCNLNCKYCFMKEKEDYKGEVIDFELFKKIVQRIIHQRTVNGRQKIPLSISLHGGEFLMVGKERLYLMLEYMKYHFFINGIQHDIGCQTNATLLDDDIIKIFQKFEVRIGLSFDGIHDSNNSRTDIKQEVFENKFELIESHRVPYSFIMVAGKNNIDKIQENQNYLCNIIDTPEYKINYAEDMDNPGEESEIEISGKEMFEKAWKPELEKILSGEKSREWHINNCINKALIDILSYHGNNTGGGCFGKYCGAGVTMIAIEPDGEMDYCDRYSKKFPEAYVQHALDYDFLGVHQLRKVTEHNRMKIDIFKKTGCDTCYANYICEYGCMTFYYSKYGEYGIEKKLVCDQFKMIYDYVLKNLDKFIEVYYDTYGCIYSNDDVFMLNNTTHHSLIKEGYELQISEDKKSITINKKE